MDGVADLAGAEPQRGQASVVVKSVARCRMDWAGIESALCEVAEKLEVEVRHVRYEGEGGLCVIRGKRVLAVNDSLDTPDRVAVMAKALACVPGIEDVYIVPEVRTLLEKYGAEGV